MASLLLSLLVPGACALIVALMIDGAIPVPLYKLAQFPFKDRPATNGALLGLILLSGRMVAAGPYEGGACR